MDNGQKTAALMDNGVRTAALMDNGFGQQTKQIIL